ncbi:MAG: helix-turn-helix domain-containing protein, partial [Planctomycetota bacterium]
LDQDREVIRTKKPLIGQLERHYYASGQVGWCLTYKYPLISHAGEAIGLVGFSRDLARPNESSEDYRHVDEALRFARKNIAKPASVMEMARVAGLSRYQLDRRMRTAFGLSAGQWLLKQRIDLACQRLTESDEPISAIAIAAGYADQSAFSRQFRRTTGISPGQYRASA